MACLEQQCVQCNWMDARNEFVLTCPECGGHVVNHFDEADELQPDYDEEFARYDDDDPSLLGAN